MTYHRCVFVFHLNDHPLSTSFGCWFHEFA